MTFTPAPPPTRAPDRTDRLLAALGGILAGCGGLAVAALVTVTVRPEAAPVVAVGGFVVDHTPAGVKEWAIRAFGESDKDVLQTGVLIVLAVLAAGLGVLALRHRALALAGVGALGLVGALAAVTRPDSESWTDVLPALAGAAASAAVLYLLTRRLVGPPTTTPARSRRRFLVAGAGTLVGAVGATFLARSAGGDRSANATASRNALRLPRPASPAPAVPAGAQLPVDGISPFVTPNRDFYRVDTALVVPRVDADSWTLRIHGLGVSRELTVTLRDLFRREVVERDLTLNCVSNEVGGPYIGNARWLGVRLADLLREAGVRPPSAGGPADQLVARSVDGMTIGSPVETVMDGRDALLAFGMNGEPLPFVHGFPVRMLVPGLYGYVSACKWISSLELTTFAAYDAYWVPRGWSAQAPVKTQSRIDTPKAYSEPRAGTVAVAGVAWAQHRGVSRVQVRVDDGPWQDAELGAQDSRDTWREWVYRWRAEPGRHTLTARATDGTGAVQTEQRAGTMPDGATGLHSVTVTVAAAQGGAPARGARPGPSSTGRR
ncbi:molybdopterin-dependent oxidoreductase [Streptomyces sp. NPDC046374]|uniref:molybdopterin-dependent oxidoreductase n=1 Tax=Streptomyces sp. NPDC046374 TaxID=3154917 RepID=UPI0033E99365